MPGRQWSSGQLILAPLRALGEMQGRLNQTDEDNCMWETIVVALCLGWMEEDGDLLGRVGCEE